MTWVNTYTYTDNKSGRVVFQVRANYLDQADKVYKKVIGIDAEKQPWVGVKIEFTGLHGDTKIPEVSYP